MSWTTPRTWVDGEFVTASMMNTHLRDNVGYILPSSTASDVPFSAGNFVAGAGQTWTVASGDVVVFWRFRIANLVLIGLQVTTSTLSGTPQPELRVTISSAIPAGTTVTRNSGCRPAWINEAGVVKDGFCRAQAGVSYVSFWKQDLANWANGTDTLYLYATLFFVISPVP